MSKVYILRLVHLTPIYDFNFFVLHQNIQNCKQICGSFPMLLNFLEISYTIKNVLINCVNIKIVLLSYSHQTGHIAGKNIFTLTYTTTLLLKNIITYILHFFLNVWKNVKWILNVFLRLSIFKKYYSWCFSRG